MNLILVTPATVLPVTVDEVSSHTRLDAPTASDQTLVETYINAASSWAFGVSGWTGRSLTEEEYDQTFNGWTRCSKGFVAYELPLARASVLSITSVKYIDTNGDEQTLDAGQYRIVRRYDQGIVVPAYNVSLPTLRDQEDAITVRYKAGYGTVASDIPADLRVKLMQLSAFLWENRLTVPPAAFVDAFRQYQVSWSV